ncbi:hypothetical protein BST61_g5672 [Cercospora zeina]
MPWLDDTHLHELSTNATEALTSSPLFCMPHEERSEYSKKMAPQTFSFITQEDPDKFKSRGTKRKIRSHVASTQHRNNRLTAKDARQTRFRTNLSIQDFERVHSPPSKRRPASKNDRKVVSPHTKTIQRRRNRSSSPSPTHEKDLSVLASPERNRAKPASGNSHTMFLARQSDLTSQATAAVYPVTYESWFDWLTSYCCIPPGRGGWNYQSPHCITCLFYLLPVSLANGSFPLIKALWLRGKTIQAINEALNDPKRATSNALVVAMGQLALHEHIYGDRALAHKGHRLAQQKMIQLRGGILQCDLPSFTLQVMIWYDKLMAAEAGNTAYFEYLPALMNQVHSYNDAEAINVTNTSSPARAKHPGYGIPDEDDEGARIGEQLELHLQGG